MCDLPNSWTTSIERVYNLAMDQFRISSHGSKFYVERCETERHELECHNGTHWVRITTYYKTKDKCQQFIDGMNPKKLSTNFAMGFHSP